MQLRPMNTSLYRVEENQQAVASNLASKLKGWARRHLTAVLLLASYVLVGLVVAF